MRAVFRLITHFCCTIYISVYIHTCSYFVIVFNAKPFRWRIGSLISAGRLHFRGIFVIAKVPTSDLFGALSVESVRSKRCKRKCANTIVRSVCMVQGARRPKLRYDCRVPMIGCFVVHPVAPVV